jgi:uncharacterized protein
MLLLNLARIRTAEERFDQVYAPEAVAADGDTFTVKAPVTLGLDVHKDGDRFRLVGRVQTTLAQPCSRCLEMFEWPVDATFDLRYQPRSTAPAGAEREVDEDDFSTAFYDDDVIDLGQLMREQFYLLLPMKPLCSEGCRGLCPQCGTNLNLGTCGCVQRDDDPRFAALRALRAGAEQDPGNVRKP